MMMMMMVTMTMVPSPPAARLRAVLRYSLVLEADVPVSRVVFTASTPSRRVSASVNVTEGQICFQHRIAVQACVPDYYHPIDLSVDFDLIGKPIASAGNLTPSLSTETLTHRTETLEFETNCRSKDKCVSDLSVSLNKSGAQTLVLVPGATLHFVVRLQNRGEESVRTRVTIPIPLGLAFRKISESDRSKCSFPETPNLPREKDIISCNVSHPILPENTQMAFDVLLDVMWSAVWSEHLVIRVMAFSENEANETLTDNEANATLSILYPTNLVINREDFTPEVILKIGSTEMESIHHYYRVSNLAAVSLPVSVTFLIPLEVSPGLVWDIQPIRVGQKSADCSVPTTNLSVKNHLNQALSCPNKTCRIISCEIALLTNSEPVVFHLQGSLVPNSLSTVGGERLRLTSRAWVGFDRRMYAQTSPDPHQGLHHQITTRVEFVQVQDYVPILAGGAGGGLVLFIIIGLVLYKVGFFNRGLKTKMDQGGEGQDNGCQDSLQPEPTEAL
uniref:Integrin alpha-M n=1 Tax=Callorhinchus milii TaxID=7868 RepID=V9KUM0_CALMI